MIVGGLGGEGLLCFLEGLLVFFSIGSYSEGSEVEGLESEGLLVFGDFILLTRGSSSRSYSSSATEGARVGSVVFSRDF